MILKLQIDGEKTGCKQAAGEEKQSTAKEPDNDIKEEEHFTANKITSPHLRTTTPSIKGPSQPV